MELTDEQKNQWKIYQNTNEYKDFLAEMMILKYPLDENILKPYLFTWWCKEYLNITFDDVEQPQANSYNPITIVYDNEEEFLLANPHIKKFEDDRNKNIPTILNESS